MSAACWCGNCHGCRLAREAGERNDTTAEEDEALCPECKGDGGDKWNDYALPCPTCGGEGRLW